MGKKSKNRIKKSLRNTKKVKKQIGGVDASRADASRADASGADASGAEPEPEPELLIVDEDITPPNIITQEEASEALAKLNKYKIDRNKHIHQASRLILTQNILLCQNVTRFIYNQQNNGPRDEIGIKAFHKAYLRPEEISADGNIDITIDVIEQEDQPPTQQSVSVNIENLIAYLLTPPQKIMNIFRTYLSQNQEKEKIFMIVDINMTYHLCIYDKTSPGDGIILLKRENYGRNYYFQHNQEITSPDIQTLVNKFLPLNDLDTSQKKLKVPNLATSSSDQVNYKEIELKDYTPIPEGFLNRRT